MSERTFGVVRTRAHSTQDSATLEVLELGSAKQGQLGSGIILYFNMEEKPSLLRGEGEANSDSRASG